MTPALRKFTITTHLAFSIGWLGATAAFLVLSIAGLASRDPEVVRGAYLSMNLISKFVIIPMSFAGVATGLFQALATPWGVVPVLLDSDEIRLGCSYHSRPADAPICGNGKGRESCIRGFDRNIVERGVQSTQDRTCACSWARHLVVPLCYGTRGVQAMGLDSLRST